jgi:hypothetical protein
MGAMPGLRQVSLYIEPDLYSQAKIVSIKTGRPLYKVINDALRAEVEKHVPPGDRKTLNSFIPEQEEEVHERSGGRSKANSAHPAKETRPRRSK